MSEQPPPLTVLVRCHNCGHADESHINGTCALCHARSYCSHKCRVADLKEHAEYCTDHQDLWNKDVLSVLKDEFIPTSSPIAQEIEAFLDDDTLTNAPNELKMILGNEENIGGILYQSMIWARLRVLGGERQIERSIENGEYSRKKLIDIQKVLDRKTFRRRKYNRLRERVAVAIANASGEEKEDE